MPLAVQNNQDPNLLNTIKADFSALFSKIEEYRERREGHKARLNKGERLDPIGPYNMAIESLSYREQIPWFNDAREESWQYREGWANPKDYILVRDDKQALKNFTEKILDIPPHQVGHDRGGSSRIVEPAEYLVWLYKVCENEKFKTALLETVKDLLTAELNKKLEPLGLDSTREQQEQRFEQINKIIMSQSEKWDLRETLWRLDMDPARASLADKETLYQILKELSKTARPITLDEADANLGNSREDLIEMFEAGRFKDRTLLHFEEVSDEIKTKLYNWRLEKSIFKEAEKQYSPQITRLIGLLYVVSRIGSPDNELRELLPELQEKFENSFLGDVSFRNTDCEISAFSRITDALAALQKKDSTALWLKAISKTDSVINALQSIESGLSGLRKSSEIKQFAVETLSAISNNPLLKKAEELDKKLSSIPGVEMRFNLMEDFSNQLQQKLKNKGFASTFCDEMPRQITIVRLERQKEEELLSIATTIISETEVLEGKCKLDSYSGSFVGEERYCEAAKKLIAQMGVPLDQNLIINSLEYQTIAGGSKLFRLPTPQDKGSVEGIVTINHTHIAFLYDPKRQIFKFAYQPKLDAGNLFFMKKDQFVEESLIAKLDTADKIDEQQLVEITKVRENILAKASEAMQKGKIGVPIYALEHALNNSPDAEEKIIKFLEKRIPF